MNQTHHTFETWERALAAISEERQKYALCKKVLYHLNINKVYLDSTLSLTKFSSIVGTNTTYLSNAINEGFGCNLKYLVNWYRIQYAKTLLKECQDKVCRMPSMCGFASKSAFYASFKKMERITPLQYMIENMNTINERKEKQKTNRLMPAYREDKGCLPSHK